MTQSLLFTALPIRGLTLKHRVVVAPMHQYSAAKGFATDWHIMNAAQKLELDPEFKLLPPPYRYWLARRAATVPEVPPSTFATQPATRSPKSIDC